ncbi:uncharacterized protein LOC143849357 [Tasmannia lanceolata]|uniref:uncharacterized protein LOC143849357 n=1 Tax=Tasmannia lanceolata TaxID=3420 RepID=UPI004062D11A
MTTMSEDGERTCPLCAEEMDLTDQQLKPCNCGYEICVWCWHHIIDMAEKDDTDGRCPACRAPYNKEKIVGMAANCERMVAEINSERRLKSQKAKLKTSEGRKHLSDVRVIQRNLAYIMGIPTTLADEGILARKEYFGQYGKVLKVSVTRATGGGQHSSNNNACSVYVTYSKEEEAVRCIQSVHGFVLEGRSLRACFGTTKYCHTWLRNMPCNNPDCLYLHDIGAQEDSFTKDEILSAFTRSRVLQITGATINLQRSGTVLPPPADEFCNSGADSSGKLMVKSASSNPSNNIKGSPPNGSYGRSSVLPAAASWGSNCRPPSASAPCLQEVAKQKSDTFTTLHVFSSGAASPTLASELHTGVAKTSIVNENQLRHVNSRSGPLETSKQCIEIECPTTTDAFSDCVTIISTHHSYSSPFLERDRGITMPQKITDPDDDLDRRQSRSCSPDKVAHGSVAVDAGIQSLCSGLSSFNIDSHLGIEHTDTGIHQSSASNHFSDLLPGNSVVGVRQFYTENGFDDNEVLTSQPLRRADVVSKDAFVSRELSKWSSELQTQVLPAPSNDMDEALSSGHDRRLKMSEVVTHTSYLPYLSSAFKLLNRSHGDSSPHGDTGGRSHQSSENSRTVATKVVEALPLFTTGGSVLSNGYKENKFGSSTSELGNVSECSEMFSNVEQVRYLERLNGDASEVEKTAIVDMGESIIISNILSMDSDAWGNSLTSPHSLAKLFSESDKQNGSLRLSNSRKPQNSNQSRFSFARQEDFVNQATHLESSPCQTGETGYVEKKCFDLQGSMENWGDSNGDGLQNGFTDSKTPVNGHFVLPSSKVSVSRTLISAPPGFSVPSRATPPGFSPQERTDRTFDPTYSANQLHESSSVLRKQYQVPLTGNGSSIGDVEFIDPAILAVGKGRLPLGLSNSGLDLMSSLSPHLCTSESDPRLRLLMQQTISTHQNFRFPDHVADRFPPSNDAYIPSRLVDQTQGSSFPPFAQMSLQQSRNSYLSNGQWGGWNEVPGGNDLGVAEFVRNENLGFNKYFPGYDEQKYGMPTSGDLYKRAFGM